MTGQVRTVDGRVAGRRGQATQQKLLDCLREMLKTSPYRDVKVIDVARLAGTSPATFYQYFPDIEGAVLEIAEVTADEAAELSDLISGKAWTGKAGYTSAEELVSGFLAFWRKHESILRVVDLASAEGDKRFNKLRSKILQGVATPLAATIKENKAKGGPEVSPAAMAGVLVNSLAAAAGNQKGLDALGVKSKDLKPQLTQLLYLSVVGKKPPK